MKSYQVCKAVWVAAILTGALTVLAAEEAKPSIKSDGSLLNETFDAAAMPKDWTAGNGRRDVTFKDGLCILNPGKGDNYVVLPALKIDLEKPLVIELALSIPELTEGGYTILNIERKGGSFAITLQVAAEGNRVLVGGKQVGALKPKTPHTLTLQCNPDGSYQGIVTAPHIEHPYIRTVNGPDGVIDRIMLGNVANSGVGSLHVDQIKVGPPAK